MSKVRGFMLIGGQEIIGQIKEMDYTHYILQDVVSVGVKQSDVPGQASMGFMPVSFLADTPAGSFLMPELKVPLASVLMEYDVKQNIVQNYLAMKSNIVLTSNMPTSNPYGVLK